MIDVTDDTARSEAKLVDGLGLVLLAVLRYIVCHYFWREAAPELRSVLGPDSHWRHGPAFILSLIACQVRFQFDNVLLDELAAFVGVGNPTKGTRTATAGRVDEEVDAYLVEASGIPDVLELDRQEIVTVRFRRVVSADFFDQISKVVVPTFVLIRFTIFT